jgi:hypothetical protein
MDMFKENSQMYKQEVHYPNINNLSLWFIWIWVLLVPE